jgi:predicted metal-dependent hydrolase
MSPGRRDPQIALRLDGSEPDPAGRWHDGAALAYLGGSLRLVLGTPHHEALHTGDTLELPLPPEATPRQIQDRAEAWLREQAKRILEQVIVQKSRRWRDGARRAWRCPSPRAGIGSRPRAATYCAATGA